MWSNLILGSKHLVSTVNFSSFTNKGIQPQGMVMQGIEFLFLCAGVEHAPICS